MKRACLQRQHRVGEAPIVVWVEDGFVEELASFCHAFLLGEVVREPCEADNGAEGEAAADWR